MSYRLNDPNPKSRRPLIDQLAELESNRHVWESMIMRVNCQVSRIRELGILYPSIALGPIVLGRSFGINGPTDSGEIVQAAICVERGLVAVFWDADHYDEEQANRYTIELEASKRAIPLADCSPAIRWLVAKHAGKLLGALTFGAWCE